ncbi:hypothetical protein EB093_09295 [bacterium]|nr:hypothetical protein [bacterium]
MQVGSFYELYDIQNPETGKTLYNVSEIVDILGLQTSAKTEAQTGHTILTAGLPEYSLHRWAAKLTQMGWTVVIVEQNKDSTGRVQNRTVTRILSPGTHIETASTVEVPSILTILFRAAAVPPSGTSSCSPAPSYAVSSLDLTTGQTKSYTSICHGTRDTWTADNLQQFTCIFPPKEVIVYEWCAQDETIISGALLVTGAVDIRGSLVVNNFDVSVGGWRDIWSADLTKGQNVQSWSDGVSNPVVDEYGKTLSWIFHQGSGVTADMTSSGLRLTYPSQNLSGSCGSLSFSLDDLGLEGIGGRPWRLWLRTTSAGSITSGEDVVQASIDLNGSSTSSSTCDSQHAVVFTSRTYDSTGLINISTISIGNDVTSNDSGWGSFDVICVEQSAGVVVTKMGNFSGVFPTATSLSPLVCGAITGQSGLYALSSRISFKIGVDGTSPQFSGKSWTITHVLVQVL